MKLILEFLFLLFGMNSFSQVNYSGIWKLKNLEYISGPQYTNALPEEVIVVQKMDSIIIDKTGLSINGRPTTANNNGRKIVKAVSWSGEKKTALFKTVYYVMGNDNEVELTRIDTWELSSDAKQLTIHRKSVETKVDNWEAKAVYEKN